MWQINENAAKSCFTLCSLEYRFDIIIMCYHISLSPCDENANKSIALGEQLEWNMNQHQKKIKLLRGWYPT